MAKQEKKAPSADAPDTKTSESAEETTQTAGVDATSGPNDGLDVQVESDPPAHEAMVVAGAPAGTMTQAQLNQSGDIAVTIAQYESKLAQLEGQIYDLANKYPEWMDGLAECMSRYGMSNSEEALDVSVNAPLVYIRLRHGNSKNVPKGLNIEPGNFFTDTKNLGEAFEAMLIYAHDSRKYFPGGAELGAPECQSHDGKFGSRHGECSKCPYSQYDEQKKRSPCGKAFAVMLATPDFSTIGELTFKGTGTAAGRQFLQRMSTIQGVDANGEQVRGISKWVTEIKATEKTSGGFTNAIPTGGLPKTPTTPEQREVLELLTKFFKLRSMTFIARNTKRRNDKALAGGTLSGALGAGGSASSGGDEPEVPLI